MSQKMTENCVEIFKTKLHYYLKLVNNNFVNLLFLHDSVKIHLKNLNGSRDLSGSRSPLCRIWTKATARVICYALEKALLSHLTAGNSFAALELELRKGSICTKSNGHRLRFERSGWCLLKCSQCANLPWVCAKSNFHTHNQLGNSTLLTLLQRKHGWDENHLLCALVAYWYITQQKKSKCKLPITRLLRILFFDTPCAKLGFPHGRIKNHALNQALYILTDQNSYLWYECEIVIFDTSAKKWFYPRVDVYARAKRGWKGHPRIKSLSHSRIEHNFFIRSVQSLI